ncbi:Astacin-like metalloendopeptidase [Strongyloides ratti]|uniref:Metalloendopeptidase n=1 Tax=Strongyloides ratti TaxID=34506 RepID=A0A090LQU0_STRRB|nr:Astacin-like metalloendopeptidase [Strongyloides ratti]CEF69956.1 Astacin-like metalloendopeptidase [Strongyloides ratti]
MNSYFLLLLIIIKIFFLNDLISSYYVNENINYRDKRTILSGNEELRLKLPITYFITKPINALYIKIALGVLMNTTCLRFKEITYQTHSNILFKPNPYYDAVFVKKGLLLGMVMLPSNDLQLAKIIRETLYLLGLQYEHKRYDRNKYISINIRNIQRQFIEKFAISHKYVKKKFDLGYDLSSIMHFSPHEYAYEGKKTFIPFKMDMNQLVGNVKIPSFNDIKLVNLKHCTTVLTPILPCRNYGYSDPLNIGRCRCLPFYDGKFCELYKKNFNNCAKNNIFEAANKVRRIDLFLNSNCFFFIKSQNSKKVLLKIGFLSKQYYNKLCSRTSKIEIRYRKSLTLGGYKYPRSLYKVNIISEGPLIVVHSIFSKPFCILSMIFVEK